MNFIKRWLATLAEFVIRDEDHNKPKQEDLKDLEDFVDWLREEPDRVEEINNALRELVPMKEPWDDGEEEK